ncbi:MAG: YHS domain-containing protein [Desulfarculaceae bacterium]|nr:YHS domain-containing protein [Desulfarculaceae bacterium]MCF8072467.1 YHS domain-containing protein [Desulfarculaceae bacterium]MCF8102928.1 YHS domain-containing protein [Desulfarculaceae bacterium]MCF8117469.1 YHS domain-containing protein [Desulfarculaceae bacterium]
MTQTIQRVEPCPVCHMPVDTQRTELVAQREGRLYFFCAPGCRDKFLAQPCCDRPQGWWGRLLERIAKANDKEFGEGGAHCH